MKKILMILLSLALVLSMAGAVAAAGEEGDATPDATNNDFTYDPANPNAQPTSQSTVSFTAKQGYTLSLPAKIELTETTSETASTAQTVEVSNVRIGSHETLTVSLASATNGWVLKNEQGKELKYQMFKKGADGNAESTAISVYGERTYKEVLTLVGSTLTSSSKSASQDLIFKLNDQIIYTGTYTDSLSVQVSVTAPSTPDEGETGSEESNSA